MLWMSGRSLGLLALAVWTIVAAGARAEDPRVLVYTKNGKGYVHDNIAASVAAIRKLGEENHIAVEVTTDPKVFTDENLKRFKALVFSNTNNEILDTKEQKETLQRYIRGGGGFVGIHSASGSERQWPWFTSMLGGRFLRHPKLQKFTVKVMDVDHPATAGLPKSFEWEDEFYYHEQMTPDIHVLLAGDLSTLKDDKPKEVYREGKLGNVFPLAWCQKFDGGRQFYTALGHKPAHYEDPLLRKQILGGILWAMGQETLPALGPGAAAPAK